MSIITALVIIVAFLIAGAISYTAVGQIYNKATEKGTSLIDFGPLLSFFTGRKMFAVSISPETYSLENIAILDEEGKIIKESEDNSLEIPLKPDKSYSVRAVFRDLLGNAIEVQSKTFNPKKDSGKSLEFLGHFNDKSFVFMKGKISPYGITGLDGRVLTPKENYALTTNPIEVQKEECYTDEKYTNWAEFEITVNCPEWDENGVGKCVLGPIHAGVCFLSSAAPAAHEGIEISLKKGHNSLLVCGDEKFDVGDSDLPELLSSLNCESGYNILYASENYGKYSLNLNQEETIMTSIIYYSKYKPALLVDASCADSGSESSKCWRGPCKFMIYYKKYCPPGYYYDRSVPNGKCTELESVS